MYTAVLPGRRRRYQYQYMYTVQYSTRQKKKYGSSTAMLRRRVRRSALTTGAGASDLCALPSRAGGRHSRCGPRPRPLARARAIFRGLGPGAGDWAASGGGPAARTRTRGQIPASDSRQDGVRGGSDSSSLGCVAGPDPSGRFPPMSPHHTRGGRSSPGPRRGPGGASKGRCSCREQDRSLPEDGPSPIRAGARPRPARRSLFPGG